MSLWKKIVCSLAVNSARCSPPLDGCHVCTHSHQRWRNKVAKTETIGSKKFGSGYKQLLPHDAVTAAAFFFSNQIQSRLYSRLFFFSSQTIRRRELLCRRRHAPSPLRCVCKLKKSKVRINLEHIWFSVFQISVQSVSCRYCSVQFSVLALDSLVERIRLAVIVLRPRAHNIQ
jgi:hypothetical protein